MVPFAGYSMPVQYSGLVDEHTAVRTRAGLFDVSHMGEIRVRGAGALPFLDELVTGDLTRVEDGQALYTCALNEAGGFLDDLIVYRFSNENFVVVCNASNHPKIEAHLRELGSAAADVEVRDESDETALLALQGPEALGILAEAFPSTAGVGASLGSFRFREFELDGVPAVVARTGYTGEDGVEIFCPWESAPRLWTKLLEVGGPRGLKPAGLGARDTLRLEARLSLYGHEIDETTHPFEAGLGWIVHMHKPSFRGKAALLRFREEGLRRRIVGFRMVDRGSARADYPIVDENGTTIGKVTSGSPSPTLGVALGLAYVPVERAAVGTKLLVDCRGKRLAAEVVPTPFYRRAK